MSHFPYIMWQEFGAPLQWNRHGPRSAAKLLTRDEAFLITVNLAKLPSVPRQVLKDIPRPPNTASRDD
jgi:hypothetical protein